MTRRFSRTSAFTGTAALLIALGSTAAHAADATPVKETGAGVMSGAQALHLDADALAAATGMSTLDARRTLEQQQRAAQALTAMQAAEPARFAGGWMETTASGVVAHARFTGDSVPSSALAESTPVKKDLAVVNGPTARELADASDAIAKATTEHDNVVGTGVDISSGEVVVWASPSNTASAMPDVATALGNTELPAAVNAAVATAQRDGIPVQVRTASASAGNQNRGGVSITRCTAGFSVYYTGSGQRGLLTAGHCDNGGQYAVTPNGSPSYSKSTWSELWNQTTDMQIDVLASHTPLNSFFGTSATTATTATGTGTAWQGQYLCHRGVTTGYSCGYVQSTAFAPTWQGACNNTTCASTFVQVSGINLRNDHGDSGGPWFIGGTAYGIHMGGTLGLGVWSVYTPIARLANFGAALVL